MTVLTAQHFTPGLLLGAPSRSAGVPNSNGSKILYTLSSYSFAKHEKNSEIRMLDVASSASTLIIDSSKYTNPTWLNDDTIAMLLTKDDESTDLVIGQAHDFVHNHYKAGTIDGPADNLIITALTPHSYAVAVSAPTNPDGSLYSPSKAKKRYTTGRLYRSLWVRHWDSWITPQRNAIWYGTLQHPQDADAVDATSSRLLKLSPLVNALAGTALESPIPPFGGKDHFAISRTGIIFAAKDPDLDPATNTKCKLYLVPLQSFTEAAPLIYEVLVPEHIQGAITSPSFSPDGSSAAFLGMSENGYESDQNRVFVIPDVTKPARVVQMMTSIEWSLSPNSVLWAGSNLLLLTAEAYGQNTLFLLPADPDYKEPPYPIEMADGSLSDVQVLKKPSSDSEYRVFISATSLVESSIYCIHSISTDSAQRVRNQVQKVSYLSENGARLGLSPSQITEIWTPGAGAEKGMPDQPKRVHSWVVLPSNFDKTKKYPLALLVHGGPQGAWLNSWSTRWNPAVFAEQGYVAVCPNPTGSTGYGQKFQDAIKEEWGSLPYEDIVNCFEYIEKELDYVDTDRAVALGASYGGYMMNWIQGHDLGRKVKAIVCHDGIFSTAGATATEELYFPIHDFGARWSDNREKWNKWSPAEFTEYWQTPQLVIHSEKDFRLPMADGLSAFNVLQMQGVESEFLTFPNENHWVLNPENSLVWHETVLNFINRHVGLPLYQNQDESGVIQDPPRPSTQSANRIVKATR